MERRFLRGEPEVKAGEIWRNYGDRVGSWQEYAIEGSSRTSSLWGDWRWSDLMLDKSNRNGTRRTSWGGCFWHFSTRWKFGWAIWFFGALLYTPAETVGLEELDSFDLMNWCRKSWRWRWILLLESEFEEGFSGMRRRKWNSTKWYKQNLSWQFWMRQILILMLWRLSLMV